MERLKDGPDAVVPSLTITGSTPSEDDVGLPLLGLTMAVGFEDSALHTPPFREALVGWFVGEVVCWRTGAEEPGTGNSGQGASWTGDSGPTLEEAWPPVSRTWSTAVIFALKKLSFLHGA